MIDVQSQSDERDVPLSKVGVKGVRYPITVLDKEQGKQHTTATVDLFANLPRHFKGTHMSRFIEAFQRHRNDLSMPRFLEMLAEIRSDLDADAAFGIVAFPYFIEKAAPASGLTSSMAYECRYEGSVEADAKDFKVSVTVPVTTVCPCSKAISDRGAHNQRGLVRVEVELGPFFWIEDLIAIVEEAASSPVFTLLKREDEKMLTERAYDNPKFVEDLVRDVYIGILSLNKFPRFSVEAENLESIHNHSAFAYAEYGPPKGVLS
ncbi:GTP cyclohydrolase FolE2 [Treponema sp.]